MTEHRDSVLAGEKGLDFEVQASRKDPAVELVYIYTCQRYPSNAL